MFTSVLNLVSPGCLSQADVVFLLDGSSSVGDGNFQRLLSYVKTFSSQLPVSQQGVHVGVLQFSSRPSVEFGLNLYTDRHVCLPVCLLSVYLSVFVLVCEFGLGYALIGMSV